MKESIKKALSIIKEGGIILYPTDTIWGIGCDATNEKSVERIYAIKKRSDSKSMLVLVHSEAMLSTYVEKVPDVAWELLEVATDPLTIIYPGAKNLAPNLVSQDQTIGIRIPKDEFCRELISKFRKPVVSTSANISGDPPPSNFSEIDEKIIQSVDYVVEFRQDDYSKSKPSSVIKLGIGGEIQIIR
jgi:L-threonylcarbamoyladenylate synthase